MDALLAISPIDGRYHDSTKELAQWMSEDALIKHRLVVMLNHVWQLSRFPKSPLRTLNSEERLTLRFLLAELTLDDAALIKQIEREGYGRHKRTNHDVKACELYLRDKVENTSLADMAPWIHFGLTSEDVNNVAYAMMLRGAIHACLLPALGKINNALRAFALKYRALPMLARTHGQPATPTTLGKEFGVFQQRLQRQIARLKKYRILVKLNGASGNYNALEAAIPGLNWRDFSCAFHKDLPAGENWPHFETNLTTAQIEPHDTYAELFGIVGRINTILIDFCCDVWRYISDDWLVQSIVSGEVGSSTMPHKVNPIDFENAEGNLGIANVLFEFFSRKLPISRLQRDLSDSTIERNFGTALAHSLVAYKSILRGLDKISPNEAKILAELDEHPEVITEAYQTILRSIGYVGGYDVLNALSRGRKVTLEDLRAFVHGLDVTEEIKGRMLAITPRNYIGLAPELAVLA